MPASSLSADLRAWLRRHPRWVGAFFLFCAYMTFVYMPFDFLLKLLWQDVSQAEEVWFGVMLHGKAAKLTEPLHWIVYAGLVWGMWHERSWAWPAAALYTGAAGRSACPPCWSSEPWRWPCGATDDAYPRPRTPDRFRRRLR
jgi:hypothetical protein